MNQTTINIHPWDSDRRISLNMDQMVAAFTENPKLREYLSLDGDQLTDPAIAPPYVTEMMVDLVRRGHADPAARNVYLNPKRADQVLVCMQDGHWNVLTLADATRAMFDGVAQSIHHVTGNIPQAMKLPYLIQNALPTARLVYKDEPEEYVARAKSSISAHLSNTSPRGPHTVMLAPQDGACTA